MRHGEAASEWGLGLGLGTDCGADRWRGDWASGARLCRGKRVGNWGLWLGLGAESGADEEARRLD